MRFNMNENLLVGNLVVPIVGLIVILSIYASILNIQFISELRWELLAIFSITILSLITGIGLGAHISSLSIERSMKFGLPTPETQRILYFFHWPFGHIAAYIPSILIFYTLILFDLFKGSRNGLQNHQMIILSMCAISLGLVATVMLIRTHATRIMFYSLLVLNITIVLALRNENITLDEHLIAYFFSLLFFTVFIALTIYRYIHLLSESAHDFIHSRFTDGDKVRDEE